MPPYGLYSLANTPEELLSRGYGYANDIPVMDLSEAERNIIFTQNDPAFGRLNTDIRYQPAPFTGAMPFQRMFDLSPSYYDGSDFGFRGDLDIPSFGGVSGYRDTGGIMNIEPAVKSVDKVQRFQAVEDDDLEASAIPEFGEGQLKQSSGIAKLFDFLSNFIPGVGLLKRLGDVPGGIKSLNQRLRNTDFGQSRTGAEFAMRRRERKQAERAQEAMPDVYRSAREQGFTNDRGGFSTSRADRAGTSLGSGQFSSKRSTGRQGY